MRISDWSSDVCSSDLLGLSGTVDTATFERILNGELPDGTQIGDPDTRDSGRDFTFSMPKSASLLALVSGDKRILAAHMETVKRSEEHTSELQSLMRISYAVFCLKKKIQTINKILLTNTYSSTK